MHSLGATGQAGVTNTLRHAAERLSLRNSVVFVLIVTALSNLVSNVPATKLLKMWLLLAMSSTLAGNLAITGPVANITVRRENTDCYPRSFSQLHENRSSCYACEPRGGIVAANIFSGLTTELI